MFRDGQWSDIALYAILRHELAAAGSGQDGA
jgi:hypothetical protein